MSLSYQKILTSFQKRLSQDPAFSFIPKLKKQFPYSQIHLVGGTVRDLLLKRSDQKDYDFVIRKVKAKDLETFLNKLGWVDLVGKHFGVFKFMPRGLRLVNPFDIALPRREHSLNFTGGHRDFEIQSSPLLTIKEDLGRRDFTINALALELKLAPASKKYYLELNDPFAGLLDLKQKIIRAVGRAEERFKEDFARMLRAIRFSCQLNFKIESQTLEAIKELMKHINTTKNNQRIVPYEVIAKELLLSFFYHPLLAFEWYDKTSAFKELMPEILKMKNCPQPDNWHTEGDVWTHTRLALKILIKQKFRKQFKPPQFHADWDIELVLAVIFHDLGKPYTIKTPEKDGTDRIRFNEHNKVGAEIASKICERLKLSSFSQFSLKPENISWLVSNHHLLHTDIKRIEQMKASTIEKYFFKDKARGENLLKLTFVDALATIPKNQKPDLASFHKALKRIKELQKLTRKKKELPESILNGDEIMELLSIKPGHFVGQLLQVLREEQLNERIKNKKQAKIFLKKYWEKYAIKD